MEYANDGHLPDTHPMLDGRELSIGIVQSRFNHEITQQLREACCAELEKLGVASHNIEIHTVPGASEIPIGIQTLAQRQAFDALIAVGCIVKGDTYHFEVLSHKTAQGLQSISLEFSIPIASCLLTVYSLEQGKERAQSNARDAARVAVEMGNFVISQLETLDDDDDEEND